MATVTATATARNTSTATGNNHPAATVKRRVAKRGVAKRGGATCDARNTAATSGPIPPQRRNVGAPLVTPGTPPQRRNIAACMRPPSGRHECRPHAPPQYRRNIPPQSRRNGPIPPQRPNTSAAPPPQRPNTSTAITGKTNGTKHNHLTNKLTNTEKKQKRHDYRGAGIQAEPPAKTSKTN